MNFKDTKYLIVGAGLFGSVLAELISRELKQNVQVIDKRNHIGGNCYSEVDQETGIEYHCYGTHIFHTSNRDVMNYTSRFIGFNGYRHQVLATYQDNVYQMPINLETINSFYKINLKPYEVDDFLKDEIPQKTSKAPKNAEELAISLIGQRLYKAFIKGYTTKQWGRPPNELPSSIISRLPFRKNYDESFYHDQWQGIPEKGYAALFAALLKNRRIKVTLNTDFFDIRKQIPDDIKIIYTGPIDHFFDYKHGSLEWRSLEFKKETRYVQDYQGTAVMNYTEDAIPFTRIHEPRHLHPERSYPTDKTITITEYPKNGFNNEPYYPVNDSKNQRILSLYEKEASNMKNVLIRGRLGEYKYYDMDQTISSALTTFHRNIKGCHE